MKEFDTLLYNLQTIIKSNTYCEDNEIHIKNKLKYDIFNMMINYDKAFINKLYKELEYSEE